MQEILSDIFLGKKQSPPISKAAFEGTIAEKQNKKKISDGC